MFGKSIHLFKLFGFEVKLDLSWLILAFLITWTLAVGWFPQHYENFGEMTYWWMGVAGALGLFLSIVFHELAHSLVARQFGIDMGGITLFIFGGVAEMTEEPPNSKSEFAMAIAGPIASVLLGGIFYAVAAVAGSAPTTSPVAAVLSYLAVINVILAVFNLVPAFPLDGGRVLRSLLWAWKNSLQWATRISSRIGSGFGILLIVFGAFAFISGNFVGGVWWFLIGMFLLQASKMSYKQLMLRKHLEGESIEKFVKRDPVTVSPNVTIRQLVEDYFYKYHHKMYPVVEGDTLRGCITTKQIRSVPKEKWDEQRVGELADPCSDTNTIELNADAVKVLSSMKRTENRRLMVVDNGQLVGVISLKDMLDFLSLKMDLDEEILS